MHAILDNFQDQQGAMQPGLFEWSEENIQKGLLDTEERLNARCRDFIMVRESRLITEPILSRIELWTDLKLQVKLLHETVRDYVVENEDVGEKLYRWAPNNFNPYVILCRGLLLHMKGLSRFSEGQRESGFQSYRWILGELFRYQRKVEQLEGYVGVSLIDEVSRIMPEIMACNGPPRGQSTTLNLLRSADADDFLALQLDDVLRYTSRQK